MQDCLIKWETASSFEQYHFDSYKLAQDCTFFHSWLCRHQKDVSIWMSVSSLSSADKDHSVHDLHEHCSSVTA